MPRDALHTVGNLGKECRVSSTKAEVWADALDQSEFRKPKKQRRDAM